MKSLIVLLLFTISIFAATHYTATNMVVGSEPMYCTDYYGEQLIVQNTGDIVNGDYANTYCSYNKFTIDNKMKLLASEHNHKVDIIIRNILKIFIVFLILFVIYSIYMLLKSIKEN
jgi:hypothetical protein